MILAILPTSRPPGEGDTILTEKKKYRNLSREILGLLGISFVAGLFVLQILGLVAASIVESVMDAQGIVLTEMQYMLVDDWIFNITFLVSIIFFIMLFLFLLGERLSYIKKIIKGIDELRNGNEGHVVPLERNNELTALAQAVNDLSQTQREVKEKERLLQDEKDLFIRSMSHDIRTPLTSILAYSELLIGDNKVPQEEQMRYLRLIRDKACQIKDMTDLLLDGIKRNPEYIEDARLLMEQLCEEFEEELEAAFCVETTIDCPAFTGSFDVQELRRIFDNLISNVRKYASPKGKVHLSIFLAKGTLCIRQDNMVKALSAPAEGYQIGLRSIRRIAQNYAGKVDVEKSETEFAIMITLSEF